MANIYYTQLQDERWKKKSRKIKKRDNYTCQNPDCGIRKPDGKGLNAHHHIYHNELKAWEYPDTSLITLCKKCHWEKKTDLGFTFNLYSSIFDAMFAGWYYGEIAYLIRLMIKFPKTTRRWYSDLEKELRNKEIDE